MGLISAKILRKSGLTSISFIFSLIIILCVLNSCDELNSKRNSSIKKQSDSLIPVSEKQFNDNLISIIGVGDIMLGSNYPSSSSLPPDDGRYLLDSLNDIKGNADIVFGNLEGTFLDKGGMPKQCITPENCYCFRTPERYCRYLKEAGFNLMSLANNHSNDMGDEGREATIRTLEENSIYHAGYRELPYTVFEKNGIRYGFTAFAPNYSAQDINDTENTNRVIKELKSKSDIVIVSFHGGAEGNSALSVTGRREFFLDEDRGNVYEFAHEVIDAGADIVLGHGPHVPRALELYKSKLIAYSLGNFCTYGKFSLSGPQGIAPVLKAYLDKNGNFVKGMIYSYKQTGGGYPVPDPELKAAALIKQLTEKDFPDTKLKISNEGLIESTVVKK